ncbi:1-acyl-sn-glycerol-3-phosphate acyltransferase [Desulfuromusa kysingii]|uniref:1-acyl-sn-glycerol-3-phosphate acyltransferase n=1 Tax=Desulfuromusa kysingii TaxID=37625 RepID=A0A1H3VUN6_9BACT|nr:lysophospholipid acyltransferase family protein [Desulfuromusa kysingii]SDZ78543.1 1-acyl-sn-glycerol-3-phosphate acyltransferase [Desulfuromusa kysingii]
MKVPFVRRLWVTISSAVIRFYASILNRFEVVGAENIPAAGGVLLAANHISAYDTVFIPAAVLKAHPWQMVWAPAKEELFRNPVIGAIYRSWGAFPVKRGRDVRAGKHLGSLLQNQKVMLFPEGTRHKDGKLGPGNRGVGKLIYEHHPVVIPTALSGINTWEFMKGQQQGRICFGAPLDFSDLFELEDVKATHLLIVERVMSAIASELESNAN